MLKARLGSLIILGLSDENIRQLQQDEPIVIDLENLGLKGYGIALIAGENEEVMAEKLDEELKKANERYNKDLN